MERDIYIEREDESMTCSLVIFLTGNVNECLDIV